MHARKQAFDTGIGPLRPYFGPSQIRSMAGIKPGMIVRLRHLRHNGHIEVVITSEPYKLPNGSWVVDRASIDGLKQHQLSLADHGVRSYRDGWNLYNWLQRTGRVVSKLELKRLQALPEV